MLTSGVFCTTGHKPVECTIHAQYSNDQGMLQLRERSILCSPFIMIKLSFLHPRDNCLMSSFTPRLFQKCIEALIDKQYIERREGSKDEYTYMA